MLPMQTTLDIGGIPVWDFLEQLWRNLRHGSWNTAAGVIGFLIVALGLSKLKAVPTPLAVALGFGGFWAGWLARNEFWPDPDRVLFPGNIQADRLLDSAFSSPLAFIIVALAGVGMWVYASAKTTTLVIKVLLIVAALFAASFIYNLLAPIDW
jgi:hypothetical protein